MIRTIKQFKIIQERANISLQGKAVMADDQPLKTKTLQEIDDNLLFYYEKNGNMFMPKGKIFIYFTDSKDATIKMAKGEHDLLFFPKRHLGNAFQVAPITDVWKKSYRGRLRGTEHILGILEGWINADESKVLIQMMSVRNKYRRNRINSLMIQALKDRFPNAIFEYEDPTEDGYDFIKKSDQDSNIKWTHNHRPKNYLKDHPKTPKDI